MMSDPEHLRRTLLGANVMRLRRLSSLQRAALDVLGVAPDLMGPLAERRYEPSHTQALAYLMSPVHGFPLATELLRSFLELAGVGQQQLDGLSLKDATITPEFFLETGRVDISMTIPTSEGVGVLVFVEVKVDADEGERQLERYRDEMLKRAGSHSSYLVFLTLHPQPNSHSVREAIPIEFRQLLQCWLPVVARRGRDWTCAYAAAYLKTLALLTNIAAEGSFDDWNFARQRAALEVVEAIREE